MKRNQFFFGPEADVTTLGGGIAEVIPSHVNAPSVTEVILGENPAIENSPAVKAVEKARGEVTKGPSDFGMESPEESSERAGLTKERERGPDGKFLPKTPKQPASPTATPPKEKATAQPPAPQKPAQPAPAKASPTPAPVAKVKIGDKEMTSEEVAAYVKDLEAKAKAAAEKPAEPVLPKEPEKPAETDEQKAAAQQKREADFLARISPSYTPTEAELDEILMGGHDAPAKLGALFAKVNMHARQFTADQLSQLAEHFEQRLEAMNPLLDQNRQVQELLNETAFVNAHEDIKNHPQGLEIYRKVKNEMNNGYQAIKSKIDAGTATKSEQGWALQYEDMSPEALNESYATHARAEIAKIPAPAQPKPPVTAPVKQPAVVERPLGGDRPGGVGSPRTETHEQRLAREIAESHR